jgi:hypothetical protein
MVSLVAHLSNCWSFGCHVSLTWSDNDANGQNHDKNSGNADCTSRSVEVTVDNGGVVDTGGNKDHTNIVNVHGYNVAKLSNNDGISPLALMALSTTTT